MEKVKEILNEHRQVEKKLDGVTSTIDELSELELDGERVYISLVPHLGISGRVTFEIRIDPIMDELKREQDALQERVNRLKGIIVRMEAIADKYAQDGQEGSGS